MMDIREMKSGRELDNLISERVMGLTEKDFDDIYTNEWRFKREGGHWFPSRHYSTEIFAAWEIVEKMREVSYFIRLADQGKFIRVRFYNPDFLPVEKPSWVIAETAPEAICKAALLAKEGAK